MTRWLPAPPPRDEQPPLSALEITETECRKCGTLIAGLNGRYACPLCGWVNDHADSDAALPTAEDDSDHPAKRRRRTRRPRGD
ncbi:hypothetical protein ACWGCI_35205 [Streptomyces sp. NPDC054949]|uniref:hypothetical protein n=1 Tax=unclassified Streptomyces TaxID=2593676 RepID=UPI0006C50237|nr:MULTISPECIES: hypothetical protein [unclassified Streptomyces]KOU54347.1 hypothetical protein ADK55_14725 [Streptomyces sp. WM4235]MCX5076272.1 hypothetical protein [Streptomyces sp. NBC_00424]MCX5156312.1 hypothetical protein [Streptomyces sp. NBC_00291]WUD40683.1 hypothetical protein OHA84_09250 [Streptomyces sp. NBC_00513]